MDIKDLNMIEALRRGLITWFDFLEYWRNK